MNSGKASYKRWVAAACYLAALAFLIWILARSAVYFRSGSDDYAVWYTDSFANHHPQLEWRLARQAKPDSIQRQAIGRAYADAWHAANLYIRSGIDQGLGDHFALYRSGRELRRQGGPDASSHPFPIYC